MPLAWHPSERSARAKLLEFSIGAKALFDAKAVKAGMPARKAMVCVVSEIERPFSEGNSAGVFGAECGTQQLVYPKQQLEWPFCSLFGLYCPLKAIALLQAFPIRDELGRKLARHSQTGCQQQGIGK